MTYNNRYKEAPSNNLDPTRFAQNPTRAKSTRWTAAKAHNYDGDDWGDEYEDEYNSDIYSSPYQSQQRSHSSQYGGAYGAGQSQYGSQDFSLSRSSTQPVSQESYPNHEAQEETPKPLIRQGTTPVASASQRYSSSGIQRKPSKMDKDREPYKRVQHENEYVEPAVSSPSGPVQIVQSTSPFEYNTAPIVSHPAAIVDDSRANNIAANEGNSIASTKQPESFASASPIGGSPTLRRPADIYAAANQNISNTPILTVDTGSYEVSEPVIIEKLVEPSQPAPSIAETGTPQPKEESPLPPQIHRETTPVPQFEIISPQPATSPEVNVQEGNAYPPPPRIEEQPPSPLSDSPERNDIYSISPGHSNIPFGARTNDDFDRNINIVTLPPPQPGHFLTIPEPVQEPPRGYESDSDEEGGLFHTSTPPRRGSLSPTAGGDFNFDGVTYPIGSDSPLESHPGDYEVGMHNAGVVAPSKPEAAPQSENENQLLVSPTSPTDEAATPQPQPQSIVEKVSDVTGSVANTFSSFVASALHRDQGPETNPIIRTDSPVLQPREQTTSPSLAISSRPETPAEAAAQTHPTAIGDVQSSQATQPDNVPLETENHVRSREGTPSRFEEDEEEEVIIEEARRGAWGMATPVAISQSPSQSPSQAQSPTKPPTQMPLAAEVSQPLITKVTQPVIHTPQPTSTQIEQSVIIQGPSSERAISPASHVSSTHSKTPSFTTTASPMQSTESRNPQPTSFAEFLKRSPQSTPTGLASSPPVTSGSPAPVAPAVVSAPVSFKDFMTSRGNPTIEPERSTPPLSSHPASTPPAPSFKDFLLQKTPVSQPVASTPYEAGTPLLEAQETPKNHTPVRQPSPIRHSLIETGAVPPIKPPTNAAREVPPSEPSSTASHLDEGEALRRAILKGLDAESQPDTPDTPNEYMRNVDAHFEGSHTVSGPDSPIIGRSASYKGKMPQRTASLAVSDVSEEHYRPQPFENSQYQRFPKQGPTKTYPAPPASDISAPSKSGEDPVFTPPTRSVVGEQNHEYEPSIQEEPEYQPSIVSEQYVPSPVDTVHPVKPFLMQRDFNEIPTLLNLSDILALSDSKDRIAASEKARKIHAQQSQQGAHDLQVWLHHVQQINNQNAQLWTYNSTRPGMHDLRNNPLVSGRFDLFVQQSSDENAKWNSWGRLDDGVLGSRPSTAASNDPMAPKKPKTAPTNAVPSQMGQRLPSQSQDNRNLGAPAQNAAAINLPSQSPSLGQQHGQVFQPNNNKSEPAPSIATTEPSKEDHADGKKKSGLKGRLKNILGRKKDKVESHVAAEPTPQIILPQHVQQQQQQAAIPAPLPQNEKYPPNNTQQGPPPPPPPLQGSSLSTPQGPVKVPPQGPQAPPQGHLQGSPHFPANGASAPHDHQPPPNKLVIPKQDEFLPPLSFQQGNKSPSLGEAINIPSSNSVPDLRARSQIQQQKEDSTKSSQTNLQGPVRPVQVPKQGDHQPPTGQGVQRPNTSGGTQGPPPLRNFDDDGPPPLRRISNSKPPPPRKRISSIPAPVPEGNYPPGAFPPPQARPHEPQDASFRPGTGEGHIHHGGMGAGQPNLRVENSGGYEPSVSSASSDQAKKSRLSVFGKLKASPGAPHSPSNVPGPSETGSPRHSIHTISSQPSGTTEKRNSSFFQNQLKKFDQLVVGKDRANEFHHQQQVQGPPPNGQAVTQGGPEPGINRQQSFPVDSSSSVHTAAEPKKKNRFAALISDIKTTDSHSHEEKKVRKGSFFSRTHTESSPVVATQPAQVAGQPQIYPQPNGQAVFNPGQNVVVPIPGQYHSVNQSSQVQSATPYVNGAGSSLNPQQQQPITVQAPQGQINSRIPPPQVAPLQNVAIARKASNPPPPTARFLAVPPSPPPIRRAAPVEEESIYTPPVNHKLTPSQRQQTSDDSPPPLRPHLTSSPSPPPRVIYAPPSTAPVAQAQPVQPEPMSGHMEPPTIQTSRIPEQESKVMSPINTRSREPEPSSFSVHPTSFVVGDIISAPPIQATPPPMQEVQKAEPPREGPPRVEITPATAVESEPHKLEPLVVHAAEATSSKPEESKPEEPKPEEHKPKVEGPTVPKKEEEVMPLAESSTKAVSPEPPKASNEDYDKIAVDPEGPVPEEEERIVMSATTSPGFNDWEYF
ncbi:hypothetical protein AOL_s00079g57 [Orbilia oligospora ATCC 24927]|uniref:Uncharacterized protein n=1 Tax=Arthrobotrys oligospora (strain ATCC 24927 / CBS 115.81 / DSM 1491) TaxID=756982 RepID=G1XCM2_ARTOA|nr:hypothetical protein AOL_s00079g57 [Orbilia oligospora ATCC 24927]EGX49103.1 hypothetical protein AOL_s00079g57 [Orbilia oligospora ATCC 24927]